MKLIMLIQIIFFFYACSNIADKNKTIADQKEVATETDLLIQKECEKRIVNNDFANSPFKEEITYLNFRENNDKDVVRKWNEIIPNRHNENIDSIVTYTMVDSSKFTFYCANTKAMLHQAEIVSSNFELKYGIKVGISYGDAIGKFNLAPTKDFDILYVSNDEEYSQHKLVFKDHTLKSIQIFHNVD